MRLSVPQAAALQRAVLVAQREDLVTRLGLPADVPAAAPPAEVRVAEYAEVLDEVMAALRHRGRLHCRYRGKDRLVDPQVLEPRYGDWYVRVLEDDVEPDPENFKTFLVSRMSETWMVDPGQGRRVEGGRQVALHPLGFETDPPVEVVLRTTPGLSRGRGALDARAGQRGGEGRAGRDARIESRTGRHSGTGSTSSGPAWSCWDRPEFRAELLAELTAFAEGRQA